MALSAGEQTRCHTLVSHVATATSTAACRLGHLSSARASSEIRPLAVKFREPVGDTRKVFYRGARRHTCKHSSTLQSLWLVCRVNFLTDAIGATAEDLLTYPEYALLSLSDVIGPRYYFLARHPGWLVAFSDPISGSLQLRRVMQPALDAFLDDVAQVGTHRKVAHIGVGRAMRKVAHTFPTSPLSRQRAV